jgi:hypothetical protein
MNKLGIILIIIGLILSTFSLTFLPQFSFANDNQFSGLPESSAELEDMGRKFVEFFPRIFKQAWEEAVKIWKTMWNWVKNIWTKYIFAWLKSIWQSIWDFFKEAIVRRFNKIME